MLSDWFSVPTIIVIYFGFASLQGVLIRWLRSNNSRDARIVGLAYSGLIFLPSSLFLPILPLPRTAIWIAALILIFVFSNRPNQLPEWLWSLRFGLRYCSAAMGLILVWSVLFQFSFWGLSFSAIAALAGLLTWQRSRAL